MSGGAIESGDGSFEETFREAGPLHWPSLSPSEVAVELDELASWVGSLVERFAIEPRVVPPCWPRHRAMVEILSAVREHERASYAENAALTGPVDWLRALHDAQAMLAEATAKTQCSMSGHRDGLLQMWATNSRAHTGQSE